VAAVYVYFLIFAQFGFLQAVLAATAGSETQLKLVLTIMGIGGVGGSAVTAWGMRAERAHTWLAVSFGLAGLAALLTLWGNSPGVLGLAAGLTGLGVGGATVTLAAVIGHVTGPKHLGLVLGAGTGLAYGFCNLPPVFEATPAGQAMVAFGAILVGLAALAGLDQRAPVVAVDRLEYGPRGLASWVVVFLALVWLDSAAFYIIQHNPELQGGTWRGSARLATNAGLHLAAAVFAGWMLDRGRLGRTVLMALGLLVAACLQLGTAVPLAPGLTAPLYVAGVSFYSTALVFYPARSGRAGVAAVVYTVAGWFGSAFGIGLVEHSRVVPAWLPAGAALVALVALGLRRK
jgi:cytochrome c oxidase cbb3-type subunit 2